MKTNSLSPAFWAYMAVGSFALVPVVEELYFRGYVFGGLLRQYSPRWSIVISALIFASVHWQYLQPDFILAYSAVTVFVSSLVAAGMVYQTGSLVPAIVAHAYVNLPHPLAWFPFEAALLVPAVVILYRLSRQPGWARAEIANADEHR